MKAVFLDAATFSSQAKLPAPDGISDYQVFDHTANDANLIIKRCADADIIITNKVILGQDVIEALPNLKLIQIAATGMNNVDQAACQASGIKLNNVAGYSINSVPEHTLMMMLNVMRAAKHYHHTATNGTWQADGRFCLLDEPLLDLAGRTLGIIGAGTIGQRVGKLAQAFGMTVLYAERQGSVPRDDRYTAFETVLANSDVISLHCPLNKDTEHLINHKTLALMHKKPLIINVARGGIVDGHSIVNALKAGQIFGYASDVFDSEPFDDNDPLLTIADHPRVLYTPHNAWGSLAAQHELWRILSTQVSQFIAEFQTS